MADAPLLQQVVQSPLLIDPASEKLFQQCIEHIVGHEHSEKLLAAAIGANEDDNFWPEANDWRAQFRPYVVKDGILQIPVFGVLLNRFSFQFGRWATGYKYIEKALERGVADPAVRGIAYIHHTPGGEVAGNFELADKIYEARSEKPSRAFASDYSYSAGYSLASATHRVVMSRSGGVGSVGVVTAHVEYAKMLEEWGIKITFIFAGKHKVDGNPYEKLPEDVKSRIQKRINRVYGTFTGLVARNRAMEEDAVRKTEALTYDASEAIEVGFADKVGALEEELVIFSADIDAEDEQMADNTTDKGIPQAQHDAAVTKAREDGKAEGLTEGATGERTRITAILASEEGKKRPTAAMALAMKTGMSAEDAEATLKEMPEEKAAAPEPEADGKKNAKGKNHFEEAMGKGNPDVGGGEGGDEDEDDSASLAESILGSYAGASGVKRKQQANA